MTEPNGEIRYSTKEVLTRIEGKLDMLSMQVQNKADTSSVQSLITRVEAMERVVAGAETYRSLVTIDRDRLEKLERNFVTSEAINTYKKWLFVIAIPAVLGALWALLRLLEVVKL